MVENYSEPNGILELNNSNADNFYLVIPKIPTLQYISSAFRDKTHPGIITPSLSADCYQPTNAQLRRETNLDMTNFRLYLADANLPSVNIDKVTLGTQFADISRASKIHFGELELEMIVSENLINYNALLYWMYGLHNPEEYNKISGRRMVEEYFTDIYLIVTNNHRDKVSEYKFIDAFPIGLNPLSFTYRNADTMRISCTFAHSGMVPTNNYVLRYI